jgi:AraC-like DNA-binding protein
VLRLEQTGCGLHAMLISLTPGALAWPAAMIVWGPGFTSTLHRHHCVHLLMALHGTLRIRGGAQQRWRHCGAALVQPDAAHEVDARDATVLIAFVEAESPLGAALSARIEQAISPVPEHELAQWRRAIGPESTGSESTGPAAALSRPCVEAWVRESLLADRRPPKIHPRVNRVLGHLRERLGPGEDLSLAALAAVAGLSESRFMHVFTESIGIALRPYILWLRVQRACRELSSGTSVTEAAMRAGFSDAAHLSRTFRRMLGTTPSEIAGRRKVAHGAAVDAG